MPIFVEDDFEGDEVVELEPLDPQEAERIRRELERHRQDALWFDAHREEMLATYPEQWVAVFNQRVVASAKQFGDLLTQLEACGMPRGRAFHEYVSSEDIELILVCS